MHQMPERLTRRRTGGPPCLMGLLLDNVTPEDRASLEEAMAMIIETRKTRPRTSPLPPNSAWLRRIIKETMQVDVSQTAIQRHITGDCRCG